jgi:hypothetical protein
MYTFFMTSPLPNKNGFTIAEVLIALFLSVFFFSSLVIAFTSVNSLNSQVRHRMQAVQVVRGEMEKTKATAFNALTNTSRVASYEAGPDGVFNTADDLQGILQVEIKDYLDMDGDTVTTMESSIDVTGDGNNDPTEAKPVRVKFTWSQYVLGQTKTYSVFADTLISS